MTSQTIALYGGAFDPPHIGHMAVCNRLLRVPEIREIWVLPSGDRPDKPSLTAASHRLAMTNLAIGEAFGEERRVTVKDYHALGKAAGVGTVHLIDYCCSVRPDAKFAVVVGHELVPDLPTWLEADRLKAVAQFLVIPRPGTVQSDLTHARQSGFCIEEIGEPGANVELSSSFVRETKRSGGSISGLVPSSVVTYIRNHDLY